MENLLTISELAEVYRQASISSARFSDNLNINGFWEYARELNLIKQVNEAINTYKNANTPKQLYKSGSRLCRIINKIENERYTLVMSEPANALWELQFNDYLMEQRSIWGL